MSDVVRSIANVPIRLPDERWAHIVEEHAELSGLQASVLETVAAPDKVLAGRYGELLALRKASQRHTMVVIYRETGADDGFIITAF